MSKKSKKQRAKAKQPQVRRESGIVLRAVTPPSGGGKLIELKPKVAVADPPTGPAPSEPPASVDEAPAAEASNVVVPAKVESAEPEQGKRLDPPPSVVAEPSHGSKNAEPGTPASKAPAPPSAPPAENRGSRRVLVEVDIHLASDSHFFAGLSGDISEGGLFVCTYRPLAVGTQVDVEFSLPGTERPVRARGEVRWIREHSEQPRGVGIAFDELSADDREEIHAFCSRRPPLYYEDVG